ncbi:MULTISPECIES: lipopolysaccharide assembly protein LapA domain-containing protein [unclassified Thioalkalivibrio]|uniref:lipopolysaccharide assembly protein LapA domain-containing protein n=1 Tax=unclassified Thioalkalivibrio TaxID=2621013 RepID=UPI000367EF19|nr:MULTISPECIES: lipopolysaccharide assembly protein LapA domain-containing protein [unclassified Thioalkalivibrio]
MDDRRRQKIRNTVAFVALILISSAVGILVVLNEALVTLVLPGLEIEAPLVVFLGFAALFGVILASLVLWLRLRRLRQKIADLREQNHALKVEVEQLRTAPMRDFY